jgi:hypothetical protein
MIDNEARAWLEKQRTRYFFLDGDDDATHPLIAADEVDDLLTAYAASQTAEVERLLQWKREQIAVESSWDAQAVGCVLGIKLGSAIRPNILPGITALKTEVERLTKELERWQNWGIVEIAVRNPQVAEYCKHWEGRAEAAEAALEQSRAQNDRLREALLSDELSAEGLAERDGAIMRKLKETIDGLRHEIAVRIKGEQELMRGGDAINQVANRQMEELEQSRAGVQELETALTDHDEQICKLLCPRCARGEALTQYGSMDSPTGFIGWCHVDGNHNIACRATDLRKVIWKAKAEAALAGAPQQEKP